VEEHDVFGPEVRRSLSEALAALQLVSAHTPQFPRFSIAAFEEERVCWARLEAKGVAPLGKLDNVESAFSTLNFRDKRLRIPDPLGERHLRQAGLVAQLNQQLEERAVVPMVG
jgi:hypothetical protein